MSAKGEGDSKRRYPRGTKIETDEQGRRVVIFPHVARPSLGIDSKTLFGKGKGLTRGQKYIRKDGSNS